MDSLMGGFASSQDIESLMADPVTASLIADLAAEKKKGIDEVTSRLQQFGVLRGGDAIDLFGNLEGEFARARMGILGDAAERAETRQRESQKLAIDLIDLSSRREITIGDLIGVIEGYPTLAGREGELGVLATLIASLDENLKIEPAQLDALMRVIASSLGGGGFDEGAIDDLWTALGLPVGWREGEEGVDWELKLVGTGPNARWEKVPIITPAPGGGKSPPRKLRR